jgi:DNA-binding PadR family transcriptional regulator
MAAKRRVGNLLALAVLSALAQRPMHPYEIATTLRGQGKDQDMEIKWGSLYTVVRNMEKHGLIAAVESSREGRRPERTVYEITDEGRAEMADWARELVSAPVTEHPRFAAGLSVLGVLPPAEAVALLRQRLDSLSQRLSSARETLAGYAGTVPRLFLIESEYGIVLQEAEVSYVRALLAELTSGTFPGLDWWRAYHETGLVPPELAELAERTRTEA